MDVRSSVIIYSSPIKYTTIYLIESSPFFLSEVPMLIHFTIKTELGLYLRVHGNDEPKTDFVRFG